MMSMLKRIFAAALSLSLILTFISCSGTTDPSDSSASASSSDASEPVAKSSDATSSDDTYVINIGGGHAPESSLTRCWNEVFIPRIEELSGGRISVNHFENDQLGSEVDRTEQTQLGTIQITYVSEASASINPKMNIFPLPFLFEDEDHYDAIIDGPIGASIVEDFTDYNLQPLGFFENGFRVITNSKRPINSLADVSGLKIRVSQSQIPIALFTAFGCNTVAMSFGELYSALQTGTVDGQENAFNTIATSKLYEVQKYFAETNHMMGTFCIVANEEWWQSLPSDIQEMIQTAIDETSAYQRELFREQVSADKQALIDNGMTGTAPDMTEFIAAAQSVYDQFYIDYPEYKSLVAEILDAAN